MKIFVIKVLALLLVLLGYSQGQTVELKYALFTAIEGYDSSGAVPAIEMAEQMVNSNDSILPGYTLAHIGVKDTKCDRATSLSLFFEALSSPNPPILGLLGCGCSVASTPVAEIVQHKSLSQVSYESSSVELDDQDRFPNFFRVIPSDAEFPTVFNAIRQQYGWRRVAILTQNEGIFTETFQRLKQTLVAQNVTVQNRVFRSELPIQGLNTSTDNFFFEDDDYRVFFISAYSQYAQHIICQAYKRGYTYPRYAWILYAWYADEWWTQDAGTGCTSSQLAEFLEKVIAIQVFSVPADENAMTDTGLTANEFATQYKEKLNTRNYSNYSYLYSASVAYDTLWTFAFALEKTNHMLQDNDILNTTGCSGENLINATFFSLRNFTSYNRLMSCVIRWNLQRTDFLGVSGRVQFNDVGSRFQANSQIFQYRLNESDGMLRVQYFARTEYDQNSTTTLAIVYLSNESIDTVYSGGVPPDGTPFNKVNTFHDALVICYYILAGLGILYSTVCLVFNFTQRNKRIVKLTSPNLNYFLIAGTYIMYAAVFLQLISSTVYDINYARCIMDALVYNIGYCMAFGVILAKMGRINYIFNNPTASKTTVKDWHLIIVTLLVTGFGTLLVTLQVAIPQLRPTPQLILDDEYGIERDEYNVRINNTVYNCFAGASVEATAWIIVTFLYLVVLQIVGIVLAIQTRKVKVKVLNDSKYIAALIYISSIVLVTRPVAIFGVNNLLNVSEAILSGGIIIVSTAFLSFVFIPKMVSLARDPKGEKMFDISGGTTTAEVSLSTKNCVVDEAELKIKQLEAKVAQLEKQLQKYDNETPSEILVNKNNINGSIGSVDSVTGTINI
ncbi:gamma-aminobutyric acid type B receptor subunit 2-like [Halichondria panicea]|uniref:gamma-aminobutyric acid type B receptor subunit 2-like n=1 Tax=Halichondria panicea TaxID=6063 RepID=UPI00312B66AF